VLGFVFTSVGTVVGLVIGKPLLDKARASENWPHTQGEVLESELIESRGDNGRMYSANVVYRYALDGGEFESNRIWFGGDYSTNISIDNAQDRETVSGWYAGDCALFAG